MELVYEAHMERSCGYQAGSTFCHKNNLTALEIHGIYKGLYTACFDLSRIPFLRGYLEGLADLIKPTVNYNDLDLRLLHSQCRCGECSTCKKRFESGFALGLKSGRRVSENEGFVNSLKELISQVSTPSFKGFLSGLEQRQMWN